MILSPKCVKLSAVFKQYVRNACKGKLLPAYHKKDLDVADDHCNDWSKEDLTVKDSVVEVIPLCRFKTSEVKDSSVTNMHRAGKIFEEVDSSALIKISFWVFQHPEDDGLWHCGHNRDEPGKDDQQPRPFPLSECIDGVKRMTEADIAVNGQDHEHVGGEDVTASANHH